MARHGLTALGLMIAAAALLTLAVAPSWRSSTADSPAWPTPARATPAPVGTATAAHPAYPTDPATGALLVVEITRTPVPRDPTPTPRPWHTPTPTPELTAWGAVRVGR